MLIVETKRTYKKTHYPSDLVSVPAALGGRVQYRHTKNPGEMLAASRSDQARQDG